MVVICGRRPGKGVLRLESTVAVAHLKSPAARLPQTTIVSVLHDRQLRPTRRLGAAPVDLCKRLGGYFSQAFQGTCSWRNEGLRAPGITILIAGVMQAEQKQLYVCKTGRFEGRHVSRLVQMTIGGLVGMPAVCEYGNCKVCCFADGIKALRRVLQMLLWSGIPWT